MIVFVDAMAEMWHGNIIMASVAVKNHKHGAKNKYAQFQSEIPQGIPLLTSKHVAFRAQFIMPPRHEGGTAVYALHLGVVV